MSETGIVSRISGSLREAWRRRTGSGSEKPFIGDANDADLLFARGRALARAGHFEMAAAVFARVEEIAPTFAEAFESHGEMLDLVGRREHALHHYRAARKARAGMRPGAPDRHFVLRQRGHFVAEIMAYDAVLRSLKKNTLPYIARGNAYLAAGRPGEALADYDRALKLKPMMPDILVLKGEALSALGRYAEGLDAFNAALAAHPNDAEALGGRAVALIALGRIAEATADWRRQFQLLSSRADARACVALRLTDYELALPEIEGALAKEPGDVYWQLYRLTAQCRLGAMATPGALSITDAWPGPLLALHAGHMSGVEVLKRADTDHRRAEAAFQLGVLAFSKQRAVAEQHWRKVVEHAAPSLLEYAAARNELSRLGS